MKFPSHNRGFTLFEVLVAVGILSVALVFIFQALVGVGSATRLARNMSLACWLSEEKIFSSLIKLHKSSTGSFYRRDRQTVLGNEFDCLGTARQVKIKDFNIQRLELSVSWMQDPRRQEELNTTLYIPPS